VPHGPTILGQVFKMMPRAQIESLDHEYGTGRPGRVLSRWSQFGALVFAQLAGRQSLRDSVTTMTAQSTALALLSLTPPKRSTLAEANERRPATRYRTLLATLDARGRAFAPGQGCRFKSPLFSVDSTPSSLCLSLFPWARFRRAKGAVQLHTRLAHGGYLPAFVVLTAGQQSASTVARALRLPRDSILTRDRGDIDSRFLFRLTQDGVSFVTRQQGNAKFKVTARFAVDWPRGSTSAHNVVLRGQKAPAYPSTLRRVGYRHPEPGQHSVFWTTAVHLAATTMAAIYQERWQIEWFFKAIKQHLKIKTCLGTSENAVRTHIWVALITYLRLAFLRFQTGLGLSFQQMLRLLQINLFDRRPLVELCHPQQCPAPGKQRLCIA
jgi:Transposase DDE domain/Domain of unknown function (DUF4372)